MQRCILAISSLVFRAGVQAVSEDVQLNPVIPQGVGQSIGSVKIIKTDRDLEFAPELRALPPGKYGFHVRTEGSCQPAMKEGKAVAVEAVGGHYDPQHTGKHEGPLGTGHFDDLLLLVVNDAGVTDQPIIAPRLKTLDEVKGKALVVYVGGDNMADNPQPLGGDGKRLACGVTKQSFRQSCRRSGPAPAVTGRSTAARLRRLAPRPLADSGGPGCRRSAAAPAGWRPAGAAARRARSSHRAANRCTGRAPGRGNRSGFPIPKAVRRRTSG